jgi:hypothetical protein
VKEQEEIMQCPCYPICSDLSGGTKQWCRYRRSDLPPPGMHAFDPRQEWCEPGTRAALLLLSTLAHQVGERGPA